MILHRYAKSSIVTCLINITRNISSKYSIFTKPKRAHYLRLYPTTIVQPDGSTYTIRHEEPRGIIKLPIDLSLLSEGEKLKALERRKPKKKVQIQKEDILKVDHKQYLKFIK